MKANSNKNILKYFYDNWIKIEASSEYEVYRAINAWIKWEDIHISWQELSENLEKLLDTWVYFIATSLHQIEEFWKLRKWWELWVRINPWVWSWAFKAISTWWLTSSFWIWHEYIWEIKKLAEKYDLKITKIHLHIWSENTPESWVNTADIWLDFIKQFEDVNTLDMWWWFKMAIMPYEKSADLQAIWNAVKEKVEDFYKKTWRKIHIELEPWKYMVINSCSVLCKVVDIVDTWKEWYKFIRTNTWMTEMPRVPMYWVQQPIIAINNSKEIEKYVVVGHCCESWDVLTTKLYDQEVIEEIELPKVKIWDFLVVEWTWAYNSSMAMKNYNSYPEVWEILLKENWEILEIRKRAQFDEVWRNEV
jgi:diaminopimelate decarboxylase